MAKVKDKEGGKLFIVGVSIFAVGIFFGYGIVYFAGAAMMVAGILPPSGRENDPL